MRQGKDILITKGPKIRTAAWKNLMILSGMLLDFIM